MVENIDELTRTKTRTRAFAIAIVYLPHIILVGCDLGALIEALQHAFVLRHAGFIEWRRAYDAANWRPS